MRLIDADAVKFEVEYGYDNHGVLLVPYRDIKKSMEATKTVDAVPVVRCKECKYSCKDGNGRSCEGYWYELSEYDVTVKDDDFCSYGEGKDYD